MNGSLIERILTKYNLKADKILLLQQGYRNKNFPIIINNGERLNLILYKNEQDILDRIKRANIVSNYLSSKDFPSRKTYKSGGKEIIILTSDNYKRYACIYNYLPGETIPWESYTMKHIKLLGKTMSDMHYLLEKFSKDNALGKFPSAEDEMRALNNRMKSYFTDKGVVEALSRKLKIKVQMKVFNVFDILFNVLKKKEDKQILHLDFVRGNILFQNNNELKITGVLDFEKTAFGAKIMDIARTLAFLTIDCKYKSVNKVKKYFLYSGYSKRGHSALTNTKYLEALIYFFLMYDLYKFLKHNPYEFLYQNEHFIRTENYLLDHNLLKKV